MKVTTPLGEYPFLFRRIERRPGGLAVVGTVAGLESSVVFEWAEIRPASLAALSVAVALGLAARRSR